MWIRSLTNNFKWTRYCNFDDELTIKPTVAREVYDVTGAGDTVIASIAFALGNNLDIKDAIYFANLAAELL